MDPDGRTDGRTRTDPDGPGRTRTGRTDPDGPGRTRTDGRTDGLGRTDGRTDGRTHQPTKLYTTKTKCTLWTTAWARPTLTSMPDVHFSTKRLLARAVETTVLP